MSIIYNNDDIYALKRVLRGMEKIEKERRDGKMIILIVEAIKIIKRGKETK